MTPTLRPSAESVVPPVAVVATPPATASSTIPPLNIQIEDVRAEVAAEQDNARKENFYAWWLAYEGNSFIF
jgi:hypothetical protein